MLTWKENTLFSMHASDLSANTKMSYDHEGWGIDIAQTPHWLALKG